MADAGHDLRFGIQPFGYRQQLGSTCQVARIAWRTDGRSMHGG
jgi:hypothetical protein